MKQKLEGMLNEIRSLRSEAFAIKNEELHLHLGRAMSNLINSIKSL